MAYLNLKITLMSDLCVASGQGFSSVIDTDVCYDEIGLPYIPARRLKGCLLEACKEIGIGDCDSIFGVSGRNLCGSLKISNATIENYNEIKNAAKTNNVSSHEMLDLFTSTRAQTQIENDHAKKNSLRFIRVINKQSPICNKNLEFFAECEIDDMHADDFVKICKALRNIGFNRTRGMGAVICSITNKVLPESESKTQEIADDSEYNCQIILNTRSPLIISTTDNNRTINYIPATNVLGNLAWKYIRRNGENELFKKIFLTENVIFSNFYVSNENKDRFYPVPTCYKKLKNKCLIINELKDYDHLNDTPKSLGKAYVSETGEFKKLNTEIMYHHSRGKTKDDEVLYTQTAVSAGYDFCGTISGKGVYIKEILKLIVAGDKIRVGKSKTAQYAECEIKSITTQIKTEKNIFVKADTTVAVVLQSDLLLLKDGNYTVSVENLYDEIVKITGIESVFKKEKSSFDFKIITGYSGVWNMQKPHYKAFGAGSVLAIKAQKDIEIPNDEIYVGEKQNEGFGKCKIFNIEDMPVIAEKSSVGKLDPASEKFESYKFLLAKNALKNKIRNDALAFSSKHKKDNTPSFVGRIELMLAQSKNMKEFEAKIGKIKSQTEKDKIDGLIVLANRDYKVNEYDSWEEQKLFWTILFKLYKYKLKGDA